MVYSNANNEDTTSLTMGSVDMESLKCEMPRLRKHIYVKEKAPWFEIPDDGAERTATM
jgi:hypothetical protein